MFMFISQECKGPISITKWSLYIAPICAPPNVNRGQLRDLLHVYFDQVAISNLLWSSSLLASALHRDFTNTFAQV